MLAGRRWGLALATGTCMIALAMSAPGHETTHSPGRGANGHAPGARVSPVRDDATTHRTGLAASTAYFEEVVDGIPDMKPVYDLHPTQPAYVNLLPIDLTADGLDDLLVHIHWLDFGGPASSEPCFNRLILFVQQPNGKFADETATRIVNTPDLQGCSGDRTVADFNEDGRPDVIFALSQENGRYNADYTTMQALNAALVSQPDGRYAVERFGVPAWHASASLAWDADGKPLAMFASYMTGPEAYRRLPGGWMSVDPGMPLMRGDLNLYHRPDGSAGPSTRLLRSPSYPNNFDINGAARDAQGVWHEFADKRIFEHPGTVQLQSWAGTVGSTPVARIRNEYAATGGYLRACSWRPVPGAPPVGVTRFTAGVMPVPYTGPSQLVLESELIPITEMWGFRVEESGVELAPLDIAGEVTRQVNANNFGCGDFNGDGYDDLAVYGFNNTGIPLVYINNRKGGLRYIGPAPFPPLPQDWGGQGAGLLHDFNNDGLADYLSCPCNAVTAQFGNDVHIYYHRGLKPLPNLSVPGGAVGAIARPLVASAQVDFSPPRDDGGQPITGYTVRSIPAGGVDAQAGSLATRHTVTGLTNGVDYRFAVVASNASGDGNDSLWTNVVKPLAQTVSIGAATVTEGNAGTTTATFPITLSSAAGSEVSVDVSTMDGTAFAGSDYVAKTQAVAIPAGQTAASFQVTVNGDTTIESNERFTANLQNAVGANIAQEQAPGTIANDDLASLAIADVTVVEGNAGERTATFTVTLSRSMPSAVTFNVATGAGTATAGVDYLPHIATARVLDAGRTRALFEVQVLGDATVEPDETFTVQLSNVQGALVADGTATGTIQNDDAASLTAQAQSWWKRAWPARAKGRD